MLPPPYFSCVNGLLLLLAMAGPHKILYKFLFLLPSQGQHLATCYYCSYIRRGKEGKRRVGKEEKGEEEENESRTEEWEEERRNYLLCSPTLAIPSTYWREFLPLISFSLGHIGYHSCHSA